MPHVQVNVNVYGVFLSDVFVIRIHFFVQLHHIFCDTLCPLVVYYFVRDNILNNEVLMELWVTYICYAA